MRRPGRLRRRVAELEARLAELEDRSSVTLPATTIPTVELDAHRLWREHVTDHAAYSDSDDGWNGYL